MSVGLNDFFAKFHLGKIRLGPRYANVEITFEDADKDAAWELYIELLTRIATQPLPADSGSEKAALDSIYQLFSITRTILRTKGRNTIQFSKVAIPVLNQILRPFAAKWHKECIAHEFKDQQKCELFRTELGELQNDILSYAKMLATIAGVEDLTNLED